MALSMKIQRQILIDVGNEKPPSESKLAYTGEMMVLRGKFEKELAELRKINSRAILDIPADTDSMPE